MEMAHKMKERFLQMRTVKKIVQKYSMKLQLLMVTIYRIQKSPKQINKAQINKQYAKTEN